MRREPSSFPTHRGGCSALLCVLASVISSCSTNASARPTDAPSTERTVDKPVARTTPHDKAYWHAIAQAKYAVPAGESPLALILELSEHLGSTDPELRDAFGYDIPENWICRQKLLSPDDLRVLLRKWEANLRVKIGERGTDSVLLRSFSALDLSLIAAYEIERPFLEPAEFQALLDAALTYLADEKDVRGYVPEKGWHHSAAHTADLLKFLARDPQLAVAEQARILNAIADKLFAPETGVFTFGEDERLALAVLSITRRPNFDAKAFNAWLARFQEEAKPLWQTSKLDVARFAAVQNGKNVLKSLLVDLFSIHEPTLGTSYARGNVLRCLETM